MSQIELKFTDDELSSWGGLSILKKMLHQSGFMEHLESLPLPAQGYNRGYDPVQLFVQFMASVWCGASRSAHLDVNALTTADKGLFG